MRTGTWEVSPLGEVVSLPGEILHQFREGREEEGIYLPGFLPAPNSQTLCLERALTLLHSWVASGYLRCQIPCPVGSMSSKSGNDEKRQTGHVASECQRASDIVHKTCSHSMILFFSFIRRGNLAQWAKTIPKVTWLVSGKFRI